MADEKFKLPGSSYEELVKIVKGYGHMTKPASLDEISKLTSLHKTVVSRNAGFLIEIGVIDTGQKKSITDAGRSLARALVHEMPEEIAQGWRERVTATEFLTNLLTSIRIRKGMTEETLTSHIAYSAGQPKKSGPMTGSRTVVDILRAAGCIKESDGKIIAPDTSHSPIDEAHAESESHDFDNSLKQDQLQTVSGQVEALMARTSLRTEEAIVRINIDIKVECTSSDLDNMGPRLRRILDIVSRASDDPKNAS